MNAAQHAARILAAWSVADPESFERELDSALHSCREETPADHLAGEQQELLESVVEKLRAMRRPARQNSVKGLRDFAQARKDTAPAAQGLLAGLALLEHLRQRTAA